MVLRIFRIPGITSLIKLIQIAPGQLKPDGTAMLVIAVTQSSHGPGLVRRGDLLPQHQQFDVLGRRRAAAQNQPAAEPDEDQVEQAKRHG